jgi:hypothetical protein
MVEMSARLNEVKDNIELNFLTRKEMNQEKLENEKKIGNITITIADASRKIKTVELDSKENFEEIKRLGANQEASTIEVQSSIVRSIKLGS